VPQADGPEAVRSLTSFVYDNVLAGREALLRDVLHDDFQIVGTREPVDRDTWLRLVLHDIVFTSITVDVLDARTVTATVATSAARVTINGTHQGQPLDGTWMVVDVWHGQGMNWKLLSRTTMPERI
jgi:hypothetical protein